MEYTNFDLRIAGNPGDGYRVEVESPGMGEDVGTFIVSADSLKIAETLKEVQALEAGSHLPMDLGASLYKGLFQERVAKMLYKCLGSVKDDQKGLRIRLRLAPPEIAALPWEVLYDQDSKCFLATSDKTPLTRYIELAEPIKALRVEPPVKVLTLIPGGSGLDVEKEEQTITEALADLGSVEMQVLKGKVTRWKISQALNQEQYHILHFIGHGTFDGGEGQILINAEDDGEDRISASTFADFFRNHPSLKLAVLNSCQGAEVSSSKGLTGVAPQLVERGIPAVVAMQYPISDRAALTFAREFYLTLCMGSNRGQVDAAVSHARNRINMDLTPDEPVAFATPVLFLRSPTGVIFDLEKDFAQKSGIFHRFLRVFSGAPVRQVNRLKEVKKTYEKNIEAWQVKTKDASAETVQEADEAIARERQELTAVDERIIRWNRTLIGSTLATLMIFLLGYVGLFNIFGADDWLETKFVPFMDSYVVKTFSPEVRLILGKPDDNPGLGEFDSNWRKYHAELVNALAGKAKVIVFDMYFDEPNSYDPEFAKAIEQARSRNTRVIVGTIIDRDGITRKGIAPGLKQAVGDDGLGNINVGGAHWGFLRIYQLAQLDRKGASSNPNAAEDPLIPSLALSAVAASFGSANALAKTFYDDRSGEIQIGSPGRVTKVPVYQKTAALFDLPYDLVDYSQLQTATRTYAEVYARRADASYLQDYQDAIVIIGVKSPNDVFNVLPGQRRYGTEIHANIISNILSNVCVRLLPAIYDLLLVAIMAVFGALVRARLAHVFSTRLVIPFTDPRKTLALPGLLLVADIFYLLFAFVLYKYELIFVLKTYHLVAPFIAYWLTGKMQKKTTIKPATGVNS